MNTASTDDVELQAGRPLLVTKGKVVTDRVHKALAPAVDRFHHELDEDEQTRFWDALNRFIRTYAFLSRWSPSPTSSSSGRRSGCRSSPHPGGEVLALVFGGVEEVSEVSGCLGALTSGMRPVI